MGDARFQSPADSARRSVLPAHPRNVLYQKNIEAEIFPRESISVPMDISPNPRHVEEAARMLINAKNPILFVGPEVWSSGGRAAVVELAELLAIPVTQAWSWAAD